MNKKPTEQEELQRLLQRAKRVGFDIREPESVRVMENFVHDVEKAQRHKGPQSSGR